MSEIQSKIYFVMLKNQRQAINRGFDDVQVPLALLVGDWEYCQGQTLHVLKVDWDQG